MRVGDLAVKGGTRGSSSGGDSPDAALMMRAAEATAVAAKDLYCMEKEDQDERDASRNESQWPQ